MFYTVIKFHKFPFIFDMKVLRSVSYSKYRSCMYAGEYYEVPSCNFPHIF